MACVTPGRHPCLPACKCRTESTFPKAAEKTPECTFNQSKGRLNTASQAREARDQIYEGRREPGHLFVYKYPR